MSIDSHAEYGDEPDFIRQQQVVNDVDSLKFEERNEYVIIREAGANNELLINPLSFQGILNSTELRNERGNN